MRELTRRKLDCLLVTHPANWFYLTGFTGESGVLAITPDGSILITDGRFTVQAKDETAGVRVVLQQGSLYTFAGEWLRQQKVRRAGYDFEAGE